MQAPPAVSSPWLVVLLALSACASQQRDGTGGAGVAPGGLAAPVCGLEYGCAELAVYDDHDLYHVNMRGAEAQRAQLFSEDQPRPGCLACVDPAVFFATTLATPRGDILANIYFSLSALAEQTFRERRPRSLESAWSELFAAAAHKIEGERDAVGTPRCTWVSAYCASAPAFIDGFVPFAAELLTREHGDRQLGYAKQMVVRLVLRFNPPGAIPTVCRYIRGRAHERARYKAVRDLCGYAAYYPEARETLEWIATEDPGLADVARKCVGDGELLPDYPGEGVPMKPLPASLPTSAPRSQ